MASANGNRQLSDRARMVVNELARATSIVESRVANTDQIGTTSTMPWLMRSRDAALSGNIGFNRMADGRRDINKECGYPDTPTILMYSDMFERDSIANRVVTVYPDECWSVPPKVYDDEDDAVTTPFEQAVLDLYNRVNVPHYMYQADVNAGIGAFGVLVMGFDDGRPLNTPILADDMVTRRGPRRKLKLNWMQAYDAAYVRINSFVTDPTSPMYSRPATYQISAQMTPEALDPDDPQPPADTTPTIIHWSRCIHVLTGGKRSSEVYHIPRMKPVLNRLLDLSKAYGGSAEMLWQGGFMGLSIEALPNVELEELSGDEITSIKKQLFAYMNGLQRYIALSGMTAKPLAPQVANPTHHIQVQLEAICASLKVPLQVFLGTLSGQLASSQASQTWKDRVRARQNNVCEPRIIKPVHDRLIAVGALPKPRNGQFFTDWTDLNAIAQKDKADVAMKFAQALSLYVTSGAETLMDPEHFLSIVFQLDIKQASAIIAKAKASKNNKLTEKVWNQPTQPMNGAAIQSGQAGRRPARNSQQKKAKPQSR